MSHCFGGTFFNIHHLSGQNPFMRIEAALERLLVTSHGTLESNLQQQHQKLIHFMLNYFQDWNVKETHPFAVQLCD